MDRKWIFGLSIDDELSCAIAEVNPAHRAYGSIGENAAYPGKIRLAKLGDLPNVREGAPKIVLHDLILRQLERLRNGDLDFRRYWDQVEAIGVSSIGLIDRPGLRLMDIRRKPWVWEQPDDYVADVGRIVRKLFPKAITTRGQSLIAMHNDATAKCMAYRCILGTDLREVVCLIMIGTGVNIGVASSMGPFSSSDLHPEMGHAYPKLHQHDEGDKALAKLRKKSGCPTHVLCYEGIASGARIIGEWSLPLARLRGKKREIADDVISYYAAQLCWNATLAVAPSRILIGGAVIGSDLLDSIRRHFMALNRGERGDRPYLSSKAYNALKDEASTFIELAPPLPNLEGQDIEDPSGVMGALELGRLAFTQTRIGPVGI